jgi:hypothetical protein
MGQLSSWSGRFATNVAILASLNASIKIGLFGFKNSQSAPFVVEPIVVEALAAATLLICVAVTPCVLQIGYRR